MKELKKSSAIAVRRFFASEPGQELLAFLRDNGPSISKGAPHEIMFDAGKVEGHKGCIDDIRDLAAPKQIQDEDLENPGLKQ